jgi:hypothetical protein
VLELREVLVAVDLAARTGPEAAALGEIAQAGLPAAILALGAARLAQDDVDDVDRLVPEYVTLPRGVAKLDGEIAWSRDLR